MRGREKVEEAKYFYSRMIEEYENREHFRHNLSAFLVRDKDGKMIAQGSSEKPKPETEKQKKQRIPTKEEVKYKFRDWPGKEDVVTLCERYI